ncbi:hypothetical protein TI39_contig388g00002 [Zymoseptoria brevis]|uniref:Uncharacterized protein n=1 Tax=Zymoseptoria brevis TaxID=1047168 RepID=A0A0F4GP18_9PEZI|nr:hypothetical protein TI39_contig388g00002 [Zymoseptoria brevis]
MSVYLMGSHMLGLLYEQHRNYNDQLALNHQSFGKLYSKLAKAEKVLAEQKEPPMNRANRKKWQYTKALTKKNIAKLDFRSRMLQDNIRQCNDLIASVEHQGSCRTAESGSWSTHYPSTPYPFSPFTPGAYSHWPSMSQGSSSTEQECQPQYWDLSMIPERRLHDSGYYEPPAVELGVDEDPSGGSTYFYAHELMSPMFAPTRSTAVAAAIQSERNKVSEVRAPTSPTKSGASQHKRCFSADNPTSFTAESHASGPSKKRGVSVGPAAAFPARQAQG